MKKLVKTIITCLIVLGITSNSFAATFITNNQNGITSKNPTSISYKDLLRLEEVATNVNNKKTIVVNAMNYNDNNVWVVRLKIGTGDEVEFADFLLTTLPYAKDSNDIITSLPFKSIEEGIKLYGPKWYYFGIFDDISHDSCGFIVAERIKRWSKWTDLNFTGQNKKGITYTGFYKEECSEDFLKEHIENN